MNTTINYNYGYVTIDRKLLHDLMGLRVYYAIKEDALLDWTNDGFNKLKDFIDVTLDGDMNLRFIGSYDYSSIWQRACEHYAQHQPWFYDSDELDLFDANLLEHICDESIVPTSADDKEACDAETIQLDRVGFYEMVGLVLRHTTCMEILTSIDARGLNEVTSIINELLEGFDLSAQMADIDYREIWRNAIQWYFSGDERFTDRLFDKMRSSILEI